MLGTTLEMLQWKAQYGVSDKAFEGMLKIVKDKLPENNELPSTTYEVKQTVCPLGLEVQKIHACPHDCILYRGNKHENLEACHVCKALCYKIRRDNDPGAIEGTPPKMTKVPVKVMWYFPIIPHLKHLFRNKENAKWMTWHESDRKQDHMLRHPANGSLSYGPPWAHYLGGYQDRLLGGPLGLPGLRYTAPEGVEHKDYTRVVLG
jgi:hypothetical protein